VPLFFFVILFITVKNQRSKDFGRGHMIQQVKIFEEFAFGARENVNGKTVAGNPAAVCMIDEFPDTKIMSAFAESLKFPMTAFLERFGKEDEYGIRYFSADGSEFTLCGHATAAAAKVVARLTGRSSLRFHLDSEFNGISSIQVYSVSDDVKISLPAMKLIAIDHNDLVNEVVSLSNVKPGNILASSKSAILDLIIELDSAHLLRNLELNLQRLSELAHGNKWPHRGMIFTAKSDIQGFDFQSRAFFPGWGINEDVYCGTANLGVVPFWYAKNLGGAGNVRFNMFYAYKGNEIGGVSPIYYDVPAETIEFSSFVRSGRTLTRTMSSF
jgi:PhzF family phenazine biosynthesis protein